MRKKRTLLICAACVLLALLALLAYKSTTAEPSYGGHSLNYWLYTLGRTDDSYEPEPYRKATNAIDHMGDAALPFLVKWIQYEPPPQWRIRAFDWLYAGPFPFAKKLSGWVIDQRASQVASGTIYAFNFLRTRAMPVFDDLCRLMNDTNRPNTAFEAAEALGYLGTNALPILVAVATNAHHPACLGALSAIRNIPDLGDAAQTVVPAITNYLTDTNRTAQLIAIAVLGDLKAASETSIPALVSCLKSKDANVRLYSVSALGNFGPQASSAIPALTNGLADSDLLVRNNTAIALYRIDPATFTNAPPH